MPASVEAHRLQHGSDAGTYIAGRLGVVAHPRGTHHLTASLELGPAIKVGLVEAGGIDSKSGLRRADAHPPRRQTRTSTNPSPRSAHRTRSEPSSNFNRQFRREYGIIPGQ